MTLEEKITSDFKEAMKAGDSARRMVLSLLKAALHNKEIEKKKKDMPLTDEEVQDVILSEVKKRKDAMAQLRAAGREELAQKEETEIAVLSAYLPAQLPEADVRALVADAIAKTGASSVKETGKVLGMLSKDLKGKADMSFVAQIVKEELSR